MSNCTRDLAQELLNCEWIRVKCHEDYYAQNLYAAMCNMQWQPIDVFPILKGELWSTSWRGSGGIVAEIRNSLQTQADGITNCESYIDWYCSGMLRVDEDSESNVSQYVGEGVVTDEIREDLARLGWQPVPYED